MNDLLVGAEEVAHHGVGRHRGAWRRLDKSEAFPTNFRNNSLLWAERPQTRQTTSARRGDAIFFPSVFALSPDYQAISAPRFFFCRRQKIFLLEKIPFAKANTPQPHTKCPHVCARVSHAARILERKTLRVKVAHRNATSRRGFFLRNFQFLAPLGKKPAVASFQILTRLDEPFRFVVYWQTSHTLEVIHKSPIIPFMPIRFTGLFLV